jgi:hypothetical protein
MQEAQQMMAEVRLRSGVFQNAFGWDSSTGELANRPCLCATCKRTVLERIRLENGQSTAERLQQVAGTMDAKCQLHPLQARYQ